MKNEIHEDDLNALADLRGLYRKSIKERMLHYVLIPFFAILVPAVTAYALFEDGIPSLPLSGDQWACIWVSVSSPALAYFFWTVHDDRYEFTSEKIVQRRQNGSVRREIVIRQITSLQIRDGHLMLQAGQHRLNVHLSQDLRQALAERQKRQPNQALQTTPVTRSEI